MSCLICGKPLPPKFKKYCSKKCRTKAFNASRPYREKVEVADRTIDTFGFLTRKGLARVEHYG